MASTDPALALQKALFDALKGHTDAGANVFDRVSDDVYPRITLGDGQSVPSIGICGPASESFLDVDVWSRAPGYPQTKTIADQVRTILHDADLPLTGHRLDLLTFRDVVYSRDPDGLTSRARMTFRALTQPTA